MTLASGAKRVATEAEGTTPEPTETTLVERVPILIVRFGPEAANPPRADDLDTISAELARALASGTEGSGLVEGPRDIDMEPDLNASAFDMSNLSGHGHFGSSVTAEEPLSAMVVATQPSGYGLSYEPVGTAFEYAGLPQETTSIFTSRPQDIVDRLGCVISLPDAWGSSAALVRPTVLPSAWEFTRSLGASSVGKQAKVLLASIQENWLVMLRTHPEASNLPKLHSHLVEDGSVLFEWVLPQLRLGFGLEEDPSVSGWFLVTGDEHGRISASGHIEGAHLPTLVSWLLSALNSFS